MNEGTGVQGASEETVLMEKDEKWEALFKVVRDAVADQFGVHPDRVSSTRSILEAFSADSLDVLQIVIRLEDLLRVEIPEEDTPCFLTVRDATEYLYKKGVMA